MDPSEHERQRAFDHNHALVTDGKLFRIVEQYGIRYTINSLEGCADAPYSIPLRAGDATTTCYGKTPREAAQRAFDWLRKRGLV